MFRLRPVVISSAGALAAGLGWAATDDWTWKRPRRFPFRNSGNDDDKLEDKKALASRLVRSFMVRHGVPGLSLGISVDGQPVWRTGFGFADVETGAPCTGRTVMRIASISKSITAIIAAQLVDQGKLDLQTDIRSLVSEWPEKTVDRKPVKITLRQLLSHTSGVRHYAKKPGSADAKDEANDKKIREEAAEQEMLLNKSYATVKDSLEVFKNDDLWHAPGTAYLYTTHGFTLVSAALEGATGREFRDLVASLCRQIGMTSTRFDEKRRLVNFRAQYYEWRDKELVRVPEVDCSNKWAGGGLIADVHDLLVLGNALLYSWQAPPSANPQPLISRQTMEQFWLGEVSCRKDAKELYGLGWIRVPSGNTRLLEGGKAKDVPIRVSPSDDAKVGGLTSARPAGGFFYHTGAAVGASSVLLIAPDDSDSAQPSGVCVAAMANVRGVNLTDLAEEIARIFKDD